MAALAALRSSAFLGLAEVEAVPARAAALRCRAAEMGLQALAALTQEGLLPTAALVVDRICAYARRQRLRLLGHDWAKEGLGLLLQRGWLKEESSLFYTCLRCSEVLLRDVMKGLSPRSWTPKAPRAALGAERRALETEAAERHGAGRLILLARGAGLKAMW